MASSSPPPARPPPTFPLGHVVIVLVEPNEPGNVGAIARIMWNFGARDLRMVVASEPRRAALVGGDARARSCHGEPLLDSARFFDDLRTALVGTGRVFALSARVGRFRQPRTLLADAAQRIARDREPPPALLFGREDKGLTSDELQQANELITIPAPGADPVLNLSHAVAIALWEVVRAAEAFTEVPQWRRPARTASAEDRAALRDDCEQTLELLGLESGAHGNLRSRIVRRFMDFFDRGGSEHADCGMLRGFFVGFRRKLGRVEGGAPMQSAMDKDDADDARLDEGDAPSRPP